MELNIINSQQAMLFVYACLLGVGISVFYDVFRILRIAFNTNSIIIFFEDLIFFIGAALITFIFVLILNEGILRWFLFFGEILGFSVYYFTIGKLITKVAEYIINAVKWLLLLLFKIFIKPFVLFFKILKKIFAPIWHGIIYIYINIKNMIKISLKKYSSVVYNLIIKNWLSNKLNKIKRNVEHEQSVEKRERKKI